MLLDKEKEQFNDWHLLACILFSRALFEHITSQCNVLFIWKSFDLSVKKTEYNRNVKMFLVPKNVFLNWSEIMWKNNQICCWLKHLCFHCDTFNLSKCGNLEVKICHSAALARYDDTLIRNFGLSHPSKWINRARHLQEVFFS